MKTIKDNLQTIITIIAIVFIFLNLKQCNDNKQNKEEIKRYIRNIAALTDSIEKKTNEVGDTVYSKKVVEANLEDIMKSTVFKNLLKEKQRLWLELKKQKNIIAAQEVTIATQQKLITELAYDTNVTQTDSTIIFKKGSSLEFRDKKDNFSYFAKITFLDKVRLQIEPKYSLNIISTFKRQKDKSIIVEYKLDDPNAVVKEGQSFIIPQEDKTKWEAFLEKGLKIGRVAVPIVAFAGGVYVGVVLSK